MEGSKALDDIFTIPCNIDIELEKIPVDEMSLYSQYKYTDYKWLVDFSLCAVLVFVLIELTALLRPQIFVTEVNIGFIWCSMVVVFAMKELLSLTAAYWRSDDSGERTMAVSFGFFFFILALGVLVVDERILDFQLEAGYNHFTQKLEDFYKGMDFTVRRAPSIWVFKILLAIISALVGALLGFPGIRYANMHLDSMYYVEKSTISRFAAFLLNVSFFSPVFITLTWILPLSKDLLFVMNGKKMEMLISNETFIFIRIHTFIFIVLGRLLVSRQLLQSHLNSARQKVDKFKLETGRMSNREVQRTVARVFYYLSAAALQYLAPLLLMLFLGLMVRTLTYNMTDNVQSPFNDPHKQNMTNAERERQQYTFLIRSLFSVKLTKGICSYFAWWTSLTYFITSTFGLVYLKYLS